MYPPVFVHAVFGSYVYICRGLVGWTQGYKLGFFGRRYVAICSHFGCKRGYIAPTVLKWLNGFEKPTILGRNEMTK